jgi:hypothetical protein
MPSAPLRTRAYHLPPASHRYSQPISPLQLRPEHPKHGQPQIDKKVAARVLASSIAIPHLHTFILQFLVPLTCCCRSCTRKSTVSRSRPSSFKTPLPASAFSTRFATLQVFYHLRIEMNYRIMRAFSHGFPGSCAARRAISRSFFAES